MKSMQMKALSLAVLALAGFGMAGSAAAACTNPNIYAAWSSWNPTGCGGGGCNAGTALGGATAATTGLNSTACALASSFTTSGTSLGETAKVYDQSPTKEQTYRFRFYIDPTAIANTSLTSTTQVSIFGADSGLNHGTAKANNNMVRMYLLGDGSGAVKLRTFAACTTGDGFVANRCHAASDLTLAAGAQRIEGQLIVGGTGTGILNIWIGSNTGTPDQVVNVDNAAWGGAGVEGVETANMGLYQGTGAFQTNQLNKAVIFDEFDSRRQTSIGP
jgi:hypothetical protein